MTRNNITTFSHDSEFQLSVEIAIPEGNPRGIILFIPGVYETKEQYRDCYEYFTKEQFICASYDHRGTGQSVRIEDEIGYLGKNAQKENCYRRRCLFRNRLRNRSPPSRQGICRL